MINEKSKAQNHVIWAPVVFWPYIGYSLSLSLWDLKDTKLALDLGILHLLFPLPGMSSLGLYKVGSLTSLRFRSAFLLYLTEIVHFFYCVFLQVNTHSTKTGTLFCLLLSPWCLEQLLNICWMNKWMTRSFLHACYGLHSITNVPNSLAFIYDPSKSWLWVFCDLAVTL